MSTVITKLSVAALLAVTAAPALAAPGNGIRLGGSEGRLHPYIAIEGRYDSNVYSGYTTTGDLKDVSDYIIHVRPGLTLAVPGEMTSVDLSAELDWANYLGTNSVSGQFDTADLTNLYANADLGISVNAKGTVGLEVDDSFRRSDRPQALSFGAAAITNYNTLGLVVPYRPGGGALTFAVSGGWVVESYEQPLTSDCPPGSLDSACDISGLGYNDVKGGVGMAWKFLPRTSALLDVTYNKRMPNDVARTLSGEPSILRIPVGLTGLITPHLSATVKAGYGATGGDTKNYDSLSTFLATVEGQWMPTEASSLKLGYVHDLFVDPVAVYDSNLVSLTARQLVAGRVALGLVASWQLLGYSMAGSETSTIVQVTPSVGVDVTRWLKAEVAYAYTSRSSTDLAPTFGADYTKSEAWLKATATY